MPDEGASCKSSQRLKDILLLVKVLRHFNLSLIHCLGHVLLSNTEVVIVLTFSIKM